MLTNVEFAHANKTPLELSSEMSDFALFTVRMPKGGDLWTVKKHNRNSLNAMRKQTAKEREAKRQENLAKYIAAGFAFDERALTNPQGVDA
jgi:hypothetical protein